MSVIDESTGLEQERCDDCSALFDPDEGCRHDKVLCPECMTRCRECFPAAWERSLRLA